MSKKLGWHKNEGFRIMDINTPFPKKWNLILHNETQEFIEGFIFTLHRKNKHKKITLCEIIAEVRDLKNRN